MRSLIKVLSATIVLSMVLLGTAFADTVLKQGEFGAGDVGHSGSGIVSIVQSDSGATLQIVGLVTDPGPDLRVILIKAENAMTSSAIKESEYIILGDLQSTSGDQTYQIPNDVDLSEYNSAAIWCEDYTVLFIAADLN